MKLPTSPPSDERTIRFAAWVALVLLLLSVLIRGVGDVVHEFSRLQTTIRTLLGDKAVQQPAATPDAGADGERHGTPEASAADALYRHTPAPDVCRPPTLHAGVSNDDAQTLAFQIAALNTLGCVNPRSR